MKKGISGNKVPIYKLTKAERLWLAEVIVILKENRRVEYREIWSRLNGKIPKNFRPIAMDQRLVSASGEHIKLLGIVALMRNYKFLEYCNKVIRKIGELITANPLKEWVEAREISELTGLSLFDVGIILNVINEYGSFWRDIKLEENNFNMKSVRVTSEVNIFYQYQNFTKIQDLIIEALAREKKDKEWLETPHGGQSSQTATVEQKGQFINETRIKELRETKSKKFDFIKLIKLCEELNSNYKNGNYMSVAMIGRTILHHVPPVFDCENFEQVASSYGGQGNRSLKKSMMHLKDSLKNIADHHLHTQVRDKEVLPTESQIDFKTDLDLLLSEIVRISK